MRYPCVKFPERLSGEVDDVHVASNVQWNQRILGRMRPFEPARLLTSGISTMSGNLSHNLDEVLKSVRTRPLFVMRLNVRKLQIVGATPGGFRRVGVVFGGSFEG